MLDVLEVCNNNFFVSRTIIILTKCRKKNPNIVNLKNCVSGCAGVLVGHPFDTIKIYMQTQNSQQPIYRNSFHCFQTDIAKESIYGLYRGMASPMIGVSLINAIVFGVYGSAQKFSTVPNSISSHFISGSIAGLVQTIVCSPMELIKTRMQVQRSNHTNSQFKNPFQCLRYIWQLKGYRGLFKGITITAARDVPGFASYFVTYNMIIQISATNNAGVLHTLMAGGSAGIVSWLITMPMDVVKSRLQADGILGSVKYAGIIDCFRQSYNNEGIIFITHGLGFTLMRAFPVNAACFFVVTLFLKSFGNDVDSNLKNLYLCKK